MKRWLACIIIFCLCLSGCFQRRELIASSSDALVKYPPFSRIESDEKIPGYESIRNRTDSCFVRNQILAEDSYWGQEVHLYFSFPDFWRAQELENNHFRISADGLPVGEYGTAILSWGEDAVSAESLGSQEISDHVMMYTQKVIYKQESNRAPETNYRLVYCDTSSMFVFTILLYGEAVKMETAQQIAATIDRVLILGGNGAGEKAYSGRECRILILGNSFLSSSQVGEILRQMAMECGENLYVEDVGIGMANVHTFAFECPEIWEQIRANWYDAIFVCGFYGGQTVPFQYFVDEVPDSTKLVIFPAHNESSEEALTLFTANPRVGIADWKGLLDRLVSLGIPKDRLVIDDYYGHTDLLGGYAGACLLFSYLYRRQPVDAVLGSILFYDQQQRFGVDEEQYLQNLILIRQAAFEQLYEMS